MVNSAMLSINQLHCTSHDALQTFCVDHLGEIKIFSNAGLPNLQHCTKHSNLFKFQSIIHCTFFVSIRIQINQHSIVPNSTYRHDYNEDT